LDRLTLGYSSLYILNFYFHLEFFLSSKEVITILFITNGFGGGRWEIIFSYYIAGENKWHEKICQNAAAGRTRKLWDSLPPTDKISVVPKFFTIRMVLIRSRQT
jgi:hypothetical protein